MIRELRSFMGAGRTLGAAALAAAVALSAPAAANAKTDFDGEWSVIIVTQKGDCERAYRAPITISNGKFINVGVNLVDVSGKVGTDGKLTVRVSRGEKSAVGAGRLTAASGSGSWKGGECAGVWTAERR